MYKFPSSLIRLTLSKEKLMAMSDNMENIIMASIEGDIKAYGAKIVIVDNVSWLANSTNSTKTASNLVKRLTTLRNNYGLSILVLAHNHKRAMTKPINENDLAGSKCLINFCDSAFAIGRSAAETALKYIKQIKVRTGKQTYDEHNVMLCTIEQKNRFLQFVEQGCDDEAEHLKRPKATDISLKRAKVMELRAKGMSVREIAEASGIPKSTVGRLISA
jgi:KaiC/GvpD/RAD55 family RecA-like ATPase